jgi:diazepam-binding inhibitor (GABA receptor modulating acyl-CoA-binding protein)
MRSAASLIGALLGWQGSRLADHDDGYHSPCLVIFTQSAHPQERNAMADLKSKFEKAVKDSKGLPEKPDNMTLLKIYALYKQASSGDVEGKRPGFTDMVGRAKWDAWNEVKGKGSDESMQEYVDLIESLK